MAIPLNIKLPNTQPKETSLTLNSWKRGVITLLDKSKLPLDALAEATNLWLVEDGQVGIRPGVDWFGSDTGASIDGFDYFDTGSAIHIVLAAGGTIYRSTDDGTTWDTCTGATYTSGNTVLFNQNRSNLYITDGVDDIARYDGTTTLLTYTALTTQAAPTVAEAGLTGTGFTFYYRTTAVSDIGYTAGSPSGTVVASDKDRASWTSGTDYVTLTLPALQTDQVASDVYISTDDVNFYYLGSTADTTFIDDGTAIPVPTTVIPTVDTTQGPLVEELINVGSRQFGIRDANNKYRIWFSGSGSHSDTFSTAWDGGYLDWQEGGKIVPKKVADYRDGKGSPLATIWCDSGDGQGAIIQMGLETLTVGDISVTIPSAYVLPGSRGTPAPGSVVNVLNDYYFYNSQAIYNLGSRPNLQQILSTDEVTANIRPTLKEITNSAEDKIASIYFDAKIYFSVPLGTTTNSAVMVFDTERQAWLPKAFDRGFSKFLRYTTTGGVPKLLAYNTGDTRLSEISTGIEGDYGVAFTTTLLTGLYPLTKDRFGLQYTEEGEVELSNPRDTINIKLIGIERTKGFSTVNSATITPTLTDTGFGSSTFGATAFGDTSETVDLFSESSVKRYFRVQKELNAVQWSITTNTVSANYVLRTLQTHGSDTLAGKPLSWKI